MDLDKIIEEKWTGPGFRRFVTVEGCMLPERYQEVKTEFDNFEVRDDDVFVCTFLKSGTTWTQEMVWLILNNLDYEGAKEALPKRSPWLEFITSYDFRGMNIKDDIFTKIETSLEEIKNRRSPTIIKTHFPWHLQPKQIRDGIKNPKMIYVARDPRDVCVSLYNFCRLVYPFTATFDEFIELFLSGKMYYGPYWDHVLPFWKKRHQPNVLFLRYEDMKKNLGKVIREVATFLQRSVTEEDAGRLCEHLSFASMRENPAVNYEVDVGFMKKVFGNKDEGQFMRKGISGDYRNAMSAETVARFDEWIAESTRGTGYIV